MKELVQGKYTINIKYIESVYIDEIGENYAIKIKMVSGDEYIYSINSNYFSIHGDKSSFLHELSRSQSNRHIRVMKID